MIARFSIALISILVAAFALAACGGDDNEDSTSPSSDITTGTTTGQATSGSKALTIQMGDYFFKPKDSTAAAGKVKITAPNIGKVEHELVLLQTNQNPADLKQKDGEVDEEAYPVPGEIPEVKAGATGKKTVSLKAGKYAIICNLPGHYKAGMYGSMTVQ